MEKGSKLVEKFYLEDEEFLRRGGEFRKKDNAYVTNPIPKWTHVESFIQIGQWESVKKIGGNYLGVGGEICKRQKCHPKSLSMYGDSFKSDHETVFKNRREVFRGKENSGEGEIWTKKNANVTNDILKRIV